MNRVYKQTKYTVTYIPATKEWKWEIEIVQTVKYTDVAATQVKAFRAAERQIDKIKQLQGVG